MPEPQPATGEDLDQVFGPRSEPPQAAYAPCRISPFGAHTDHQDGLTCGFTLDRGITLTFRPVDEARVHLVSRHVPTEAVFPYAAIPEPHGDWGDYPRGIARELQRRGYSLVRGIEGIVDGALRPGGIATSAALQVAVLLAFCSANRITLRREESMEIVVAAERHDAGVQVGLLDPAVILFGRERALVFLDCREGRPHVHRLSERFPAFDLVLVDSGRPRDLRSSPYNERVAECAEAARFLGVDDEPAVLRAAGPETFRRRRAEMPTVCRKRAEHFFAECKRVRKGLTAISEADLVGFAGLMTASGESLTTFFECGTPETRDLLEALRRHEGVLGASYAGGGFGGMLQAITRPGVAGGLDAALRAGYRERHPTCAEGLAVRVVGTGPGAGIL